MTNKTFSKILVRLIENLRTLKTQKFLMETSAKERCEIHSFIYFEF